MTLSAFHPVLGTSVPKLVALDLDGTLLTSQGEVSERSVAAIRGLKARGVRVVLCTGRPPRHVRVLAEQLEIADLVLAFNGAVVVNFATDSFEYRHSLDRDLAFESVARLRTCHPEVMAGLETRRGWYWDSALFELRRAGLEARGLPFPTGHGDVCDFLGEDAVKLLFRHPSLSAPTLVKALHGLPVYATWTSEKLLEVMARSVNKREALEHLCEKFGFRAADVAAFGDQNNDREMLAWAGYGVAVANAAPEAKAAADFVTGSNDADGVAAVLEGWLDNG